MIMVLLSKKKEMKLENYKKDNQYFTGKLSEINRYLAFSGIAIIWIFKETLS